VKHFHKLLYLKKIVLGPGHFFHHEQKEQEREILLAVDSPIVTVLMDWVIWVQLHNAEAVV
jgi:hypothetical protein